jgi:hypothetical protein
MALEKFERYVCIGFDDSSNIAECTVFSKPWITKLDKLCKQFPDKFKMTGEQMFDDDDVVEGKSYEFPKNLVSIRQPTKKKKEMTEEQKAAASKRLEKARKAKAKEKEKFKEKKIKE